MGVAVFGPCSGSAIDGACQPSGADILECSEFPQSGRPVFGCLFSHLGPPTGEADAVSIRGRGKSVLIVAGGLLAMAAVGALLRAQRPHAGSPSTAPAVVPTHGDDRGELGQARIRANATVAEDRYGGGAPAVACAPG